MRLSESIRKEAERRDYGPLASEALMATIYENVPVVGVIPNAVGRGIGYLSEKDLKDVQRESAGLEGSALAALPGYGAYRVALRDKAAMNRSTKMGAKHAPGNLLAEVAAPALWALAGAGVGALAGGKGKRRQGAVLGAAAASLLPTAIGGIAAASTDTRTDREQARHDADRANILRSLLIPGYGQYNLWKRRGTTAAPLKKEDDIMRLSQAIRKHAGSAATQVSRNAQAFIDGASPAARAADKARAARAAKLLMYTGGAATAGIWTEGRKLGYEQQVEEAGKKQRETDRKIQELKQRIAARKTNETK